MDDKVTAEIEGLKKDCLQLEQLRQDEKKCFIKVINALGTVMAMHEEFSVEYQTVKKIVNTDGELPIDLVESELDKLRSKIFAEETKKGLDQGVPSHLNELKDRLFRSCRIVKKIMIALLDNFYPVTGELKTQAESINLKCHREMAHMELENAAASFLSFITGLKGKISEDFSYINNTFIMLLGHVKALEKTLTKELGSDEKIKEIEEFEIRVNNQVGSIADSFNLHTTIDEIKSAVIDKLTKIKQLMSKRKEEEIRKAQEAQKNIDKLKKKIAEAEKDAFIMAKKAKHFQSAATKDGLTGLYNRSAFDVNLKNSLTEFNKEKRPLSLVLFDIDNFKWINDTLGHVAGDKVLQKVAQCLKETFRKDDFIARYGGDEFAVVIPRMNEEMAQGKISNFRENFKKRRFFSNDTGDVNITVSAGVTMAIQEDSPEEFIHRADKRMYEVKKKKS
jgi:diguanylate cyclase (GGDEF)-like protein